MVDGQRIPGELECKIEQASRIASTLTKQSTIERLMECRAKAGHEATFGRAANAEIKARARYLWEQNGCPAVRDLEFWLQAEAKIKPRERHVRLSR